MDSPAARERLRDRGVARAPGARGCRGSRVLRLRHGGLGAAMALRGDLGRTEDLILPLVLASTSPQRRAIFEQLGLSFDVVAPDYEELGDDPLEHAAGKARSVDGGDRPVIGVDTVVRVGTRVLGKPSSEGQAEEMLDLLSGKQHEVVSGLCL